MLRLLLDLQQQLPLQLAVAHCNHSMRPDAAANAAFVRQQVQQLGLEYFEVTADQQLKSEVRRCCLLYGRFAVQLQLRCTAGVCRCLASNQKL